MRGPDGSRFLLHLVTTLRERLAYGRVSLTRWFAPLDAIISGTELDLRAGKPRSGDRGGVGRLDCIMALDLMLRAHLGRRDENLRPNASTALEHGAQCVPLK